MLSIKCKTNKPTKSKPNCDSEREQSRSVGLSIRQHTGTHKQADEARGGGTGGRRGRRAECQKRGEGSGSGGGGVGPGGCVIR